MSAPSASESPTPAAAAVAASASETPQPRSIQQVITAQKMKEGAGFIVRRPLGHGFKCSPFLMLDHFGPVTYKAGEAVGAPDHPHRGQETISYLLQGSMQHKDSRGHSGSLRTGDVQWMTAGSGLIHSEMPSDELMENGGTMEGFQIWVNLPAALKMTKPRYQEIKAAKIPEWSSADGSVRVKVVAGNVEGVHAKIETNTPVVYYDFVLASKGAKHTQPIPADHAGFAYIYRGKGRFGANNKEASEGQLVELGAGNEITFENIGHSELKLLLLAGVPINEPVAWEGPFVMNTAKEIQEAFRDYQQGKFGKIPGASDRHKKAQAALKKSGGPVQPDTED